eukprot:COSAG02_NODE_3394_length_6814_cov_8.672971_2_plen_1115_part_00
MQFASDRLVAKLSSLMMLASSTAGGVDPFANCGAGEAGIEVLRGELDSPFGLKQWCCGNTTWSTFSWRAKATRNVDFALGSVSGAVPAVPGGLSNASACEKHPTTSPDCFSFCFNTSHGGECSPIPGPTATPPAACQAALDAVCNAPTNGKCTNDTIKAVGRGALPLIGLFDAACYNSTVNHTVTTRCSTIPEWRCYSRDALDPTQKHWDHSSAVPLSCGQSNTALRDQLAAAFDTDVCQSVAPGKPAYPADTWSKWTGFQPDDITTSRSNKNLTSSVGAYWCQAYPNEYLDPIQRLVLQLSVRGVFNGNSSNITIEIRPIKPAGATYQITAMVAPVTSPSMPGKSPSLSIPVMVSRENLTVAASHLRPKVAAVDGTIRPVVTEHEHNSAIFKALPQYNNTPKLIQVVQGYHGANDVEGWVQATRALVGFGATGITAPASIPGKLIFDASGVVAARVNGGLRPPTNVTSHHPMEACASATSDNGHCWGNSDEEVATNLKVWAESEVGPLRAAGFTTLTQFSLHDELGWSYPAIWAGGANISGNPRIFKRFIAYIKEHSGLTTPQDFGADSWNEVVPITRQNITAGEPHEQALRVRAYWSIRFAAFDVVSFYSRATAALIAANGGEAFSIYTNTNNFHGRLFTPGLPHIQPGTGVQTMGADRGGMDWMEAGRYKAGSMLWTEDWFAESYASEWSYLAARMRCAAKLGGPEVQFGSYIVPRGPTGTVNHGTVALLQKALTLVGTGAKGFDWFEFGPEPLFPGNCWTAIGMHEKNHSMFHWIGEASRMIADAEDLLYPGAMPDSEVGILFPRSSWLWDNSTQMTGSCSTDKKGDPECTQLGSECVATIDLYCSTEAGGPPTMCSDCLAAWPAKLSQANCPKDATTGAFDSVLLSYCEGLGPAGPFSNEDQGSASMDYQATVYALFRALQQVSNIQVDLIDEDDLTAQKLSTLKVLIITEPDVPVEGQTAVVQWVKTGGSLLTVTGAVSGDRYNQPSTVLSSATGIAEAPRPRMMIQWTSQLSAAGMGSGDLGAFTAYGVRGNITTFQSGSKQLATFDDGSPAIIQNMVGHGMATHFAFLPGVRFRNQNPYRADPHYVRLCSTPYLLAHAAMSIARCF